MKIILIALLLAGVGKATGPDPTALVAEVRSLITSPDQWADMTAELRKLDSLAKRYPEKKETIQTFSQSLASYSAYFADHPFTLSPDERAVLLIVLQSYEQRFAEARAQILQSWREHPDQDHGCVDAGTRALLVANFELDKCGPIFAPHNSRSDRPSELAAVVIQVFSQYGLFLALIEEEPIQLLDPASGLPTERGPE